MKALAIIAANMTYNRYHNFSFSGSVTSFSSTCSANGGYVFHSETMDVYMEASAIANDCKTSCNGLGANFGVTIIKNTTPTNPFGTLGRSGNIYNTIPKNKLIIGAIDYNSAADR